MNSAIEFHDSDISAVRLSGSELRLVFNPAYVHRSAGRPGIDPGKGYLQPVEMVFSDAQSSERGGECIGTISSGFVATELVEYANVIPLPIALSGQVWAEITFNSGAVMRVTSTGFACVPTGDARYLEAYEG
ncbi:MAG: hypothetical protein ABIZ09_15820 [Rhodoferax sp.]